MDSPLYVNHERIHPSRRFLSSNATFHGWFSESCSHLSGTDMRQKLLLWLARHFEIELKSPSFLSDDDEIERQ